MFNPIFKENAQGWNHPGSGAFEEPELLSCRKPKHVVQKLNIPLKNPNNSQNYHDENHDEMKFYQVNNDTNNTQHQKNAQPKTVL